MADLPAGRAGHRPRWQRTDKFRPHRRGIQALSHARSETVLGLAGLLAAAALVAVNTSGGIATALAIGLAVQALTYLTAPLVALAADRSLARAPGNLFDIPAAANAAGLPRWLAQPPPATQHPTPPQRNDRATTRPAPRTAHTYPPHTVTGTTSAQAPTRTGTANRLPAERMQIGARAAARLARADDHRPYEPGTSRYRTRGSRERSG